MKTYSFPSKDTGYLIKDNDSIFKTTNGGTTWKKLSVPHASFTCIQFANGQIGYIGGTSGYLIKTIDGGLTWNIDTTGDTRTIKSLYTFGTSLVYFVDNSNVVYKNQPLLIPPKSDTTQKSDTTVIYKTSLFPNPNNGNFIVTIPGTKQGVSFEIFTLLGQKMYTTPLAAGVNNISFHYQQKGLYIYKIVESNGTVISLGKFVFMGNN